MSQKNIRAAQSGGEIIVNGYATPQITREQLDEWADNLTYVSCYSYGFNIEGELVPTDDESLIRNASISGVAPLMVLTPFNEDGEYSYDLLKELFSNPVMRDRLINNVVTTAAEKNYYGVVFNFGYIAEDDGQQFIITVSKAAARLNRIGKLIIVSVFAGVNDEGIDYESLGRAANLIELRIFSSEHYLGPPTAISPIDRMWEIVAGVIALVDPRFILLALPNYGYDWPLPYIQGSTAAETITNIEAAERAARMGAMIKYSETAESPYYTYINGSGRTHTVWFDNARSIRARLEMVKEFGLAGVSIWTIMNPFPEGIAAINEMFTVKKV